MHRVWIILNQRASKGASLEWRREIERRLFRSELRISAPRDLEELNAEIADALRERVDVLVSVGGDGTMNTLIQRLAGTEVALLVVPVGTANDLARELGILGRVGLAVQAIRETDPKPIDLVCVNGRYMATDGGLGIAADVAADINRLRTQVPGFKEWMGLVSHRAYSWMLAARFVSPSWKPMQLKIEAEGRVSETVQSGLMLVNNQPMLAGSFDIAPHTRNDDGRFNVTVFKHRDRISLARAVWAVKQGRLLGNDSDFESFETTRLTVTVERPEHDLPFFGDGECLAVSRRFEVEIFPGALKIYLLDKKNEGTHA